VSELTIRQAELHDVGAVFKLAQQLAVFEELTDSFVADIEDYRRWLFGEHPAATVLLAEADGEIAGMALYVTTFSTFLGLPGIWLEDLYVSEGYRRLGVASLLLEELERRSPGRVEWEVLGWNDGAVALYEAQGARPVTGWVKYRMSPAAD